MSRRDCGVILILKRRITIPPPGQFFLEPINLVRLRPDYGTLCMYEMPTPRMSNSELSYVTNIKLLSDFLHSWE